MSGTVLLYKYIYLAIITLYVLVVNDIPKFINHNWTEINLYSMFLNKLHGDTGDKICTPIFNILHPLNTGPICYS